MNTSLIPVTDSRTNSFLLNTGKIKVECEY